LSKKLEFSKLNKIKIVITCVIIVIGTTVIISAYSRNQSDKKEQMVIAQRNEANEKQEKLDKEVEEKKIVEEQKSEEKQKELEEQKKLDEEKAQKEASAKVTSKENTTDDEFTKEKAIAIVNKIVSSKNPKVKTEYDHTQKREGKDYYVIRIYEDMDDHISTLGWYYVQVDTEKIFEWDLVEDILKLVN
jgi:hypothetical protein